MTNILDWHQKERVKSDLILSCAKILMQEYTKEGAKNLSQAMFDQLVHCRMDSIFSLSSNEGLNDPEENV